MTALETDLCGDFSSIVLHIHDIHLESYAIDCEFPPKGPRERALLRVVNHGGQEGVGELVGWPGFSPPHHELLREAHECRAWAQHATVANVRLSVADAARRWSSPVVFAWETAILDLLGQALGVPIAALLGQGQAHAQAVAVNALVQSAAQAQRAVEQGFETLKVKLWHLDELALAEAIREVVPPTVKLRVDANGMFEPPQAAALLGGLARLDVEYVEDPIATPDVAAWTELSRIGVSLAVDRLASCEPFTAAALEAGAAEVLVLKPMFDGGALCCVERALSWQSAGGQVVVTAALDGPVGVTAAVHLACALRLASACGLTSPLVDETQLPVIRGCVACPMGPGLGLAA